MTNPNSRSVAAANLELERISADLLVAHADIALLERLKSAQDRLSRLTAEQAKATKERDKAIAAEAKAEKEARFAGISDIRVTESGETVRDHLLRSSFTITYTKPSWDGFASLPTEHSVTGFTILPPDVLEYLIERHPERIPAKIMALAPDDPKEAFNRYFLSIRRGCLIGQ